MKSFHGITKNISKSILCKISYNESSSVNDGKTFLFSSIVPKSIAPHSGVILSSKFIPSKDLSVPTFQLLDDEILLEEGDVVLLEPSGKGTILYKKDSQTNSVFLTERCNCRCIMCPQPPRDKDTENFVDLSIRTIELMDPSTEVIGITGGEPTLVWEGLKKVVCACKNYIPSASIQLLTNARILKNYDNAKELAEEGDPNLFVAIPLYADVDNIHDFLVASNGAFWDTLEGIYNMERAGVSVEVRIVINAFNYKRLPQWSEFIYRTIPFAEHVAFMGMEPIGLALKNIERLWIDPSDYMSYLNQAVKILLRRNLGVSIYNHQLCTLPRDLWQLARQSISDWKIVYMKECNECTVRSFCGGFFHSAQVYKSCNIKAIKDGCKIECISNSN